MRLRTRPSSRERGFSIIELTLVIAILPLLVGSFVGISNFNASNVDRAARRIESDLRYCQQLAMATEVNCGFRVNTATQYQMYSPTVGTLIIDPYTRQGMQVDLPINYQGVAFVQNNYQVEFNALGQPAIGANLAIAIASPDGTMRQLTVNGSGYVQVQ